MSHAQVPAGTVPPPPPPFLTVPIERHRKRVAAEWGGRHLFRDRRPPRAGDLMLMSNDYLAVAGHPEVLDAQIDRLRAGGGLMMSAAFLTREDPAFAFERRMAGFLRAEATVLCQSGWAANVGLVQTLAGPQTPVYVDLHAHASLHEGPISAGAPAYRFGHNDVAGLRCLAARHGPGLVLVDTVYSVLGDLCPLAEVVAAAEEHGCLVVADESHALGVYGPRGAGLAPELGLTGRVALRTASLSKAFGSRAGIIACPQGLAEAIPYAARPAVFSSSVLPHDVAGLDAVLDIVTREGWRRAAVRRNADRLRAGLAALGYPVAPSASQIIALRPGPESRLLALRSALDARGVYGAPFTRPATTRHRTALRLSVHCDLTEARCDRIIQAAAEIRAEVELDRWPRP